MKPRTLTVMLGKDVDSCLLQAGRYWLQHSTDLGISLVCCKATGVIKGW